MTPSSKLFATLALSLGLGFTVARASAQVTGMNEHAGHNIATGVQDASNAALTSGEIKKIDKDARKLTIQHGPLTNVGMPGMTMVFEVRESSMLEQVKVGDKIRFHVERVNGAFTVTRLELAK
jgi:Cu/Ag efflux protein CusF